MRVIDGRGRELEPSRPDPHGWNVAGHDGTVEIRYKIFGDRCDGTYLAVDSTHAHMNMPATFMWPRALGDRRIRLRIVAPKEDWKVATQLVCELLDWKRPTGKLKARECREFLERLEGEGRLELPDKRPGKPVGTRTRIPQTERGEPSEPLEGELSEIQPVVLEVVRSDEQRLLFRELVDRHHYLGHAVPFGAHLRYLVYASAPARVVGCVQLSSPAWRMAARDLWIGWDDATRGRNLQRVVNNSRFLRGTISSRSSRFYVLPNRGR